MIIKYPKCLLVFALAIMFSFAATGYSFAATDQQHLADIKITSPDTAKVGQEVTIYFSILATEKGKWWVWVKDLNGTKGITPVVPKPVLNTLWSVMYDIDSSPLYQTFYCTVKFTHPGNYEVHTYGGTLYKSDSDRKTIKVSK